MTSARRKAWPRRSILARTAGLDRLRCLHVNDSKGALGSHLDRHEHIGRGLIGEAGFRTFFADRRLWHLPAVLETPKEEPYDDPENLWRLIGIAVRAGATSIAETGAKPRNIPPDRELARGREEPTAKPKPLAKRKRGGKMSAGKKKTRSP